MAAFMMFGKYTSQSIKDISQKRTEKARELIEKFRGSMTAGYALLGDRDIVLITDFPTIEAAFKASVALSKMTGIAFTSAPAIPGLSPHARMRSSLSSKNDQARDSSP